MPICEGRRSVRLRKAVRGAVVTGNLFAVEHAVHVEEGATATVAATGIEAAPVESVSGSKVIGVLGRMSV
jgi:hypothetical protein